MRWYWWLIVQQQIVQGWRRAVAKAQPPKPEPPKAARTTVRKYGKRDR